MNYFQYIGLAFFGFMIAMNALRMIRRRSIHRSSLAWLCLWSTGVAAMLAPNEMTRIARSLGVSRGADLLLYVSVLSGLLIALLIYTRMRETDRQITLIVRQLALNSATLPVGFAAASGDPLEDYDVDDPFFAGETRAAGDSAEGGSEV